MTHIVDLERTRKADPRSTRAARAGGDAQASWRGVCGLLVLSSVLAAAAPAVRAQSTATTQSTPALMTGGQALDDTIFPGLSNRISLDLRGMDIVEVLKFLASKGELNIVTGADVQGRATLILTDVTVRDVLDIVLVTNGLAVERRGTILYVLSGQTYEQLYGHRYGDPRQSFVIQLKYANPDQVGSLLNNLKSSVGRIVIDPATATIALLDTPEVLAQMQALIARVDLPTIERQVPTETRVIALQYAKAEEVKPEVDALATPDIGQIRLDKRSNHLIVTDLSAKLPQLEQMIRAFDAKHRQVYLEATILQVTLTDDFSTGIRWQWLSESNKFPDVNIVQTLPFNSNVGTPLQLTIGTIAENDITATIEALHAFGRTEVLSSPNISALNNQEAKILVGRREPYVSSTTTQASTTAATAEQIEFIEVGVRLFVTPIINESGFITLKIHPEVSSAPEFRRTAAGNQIPVIETAEAETTVMVKDGVALVIGGLMTSNIRKAIQKIPVLGDLPGVGALFRNTSDRVQKTELVFLLKPRITTGEELVTPVATAPEDGRPKSLPRGWTNR